MPRPRKVTGPEVVDPLLPPVDPEPVTESAVGPAIGVVPAKDAELTPEQRRIRELENQLALERGRKDPELELAAPANPGDAGNIVIHFLEDGFTALGQVWFRGQELEFEPDGPAYRDTCNRLGQSWLGLRHDEFAQVERFGKVMFRPGPWPGRTIADAGRLQFQTVKALNGDGVVPPPSQAELEAAAAAEAKRRRAAPRLPAR